MIGMTSHHPHLSEERLFDCYLAATAGEALDPPTLEHLDDCDECAGRYAELTGFMHAIRDDGEAEVDAIFSAERLQQQQRDIARRLEFVGRSARVIHFPQASSTRQPSTTSRRPFPRWVAATAAAGLVAGMVAGMFLERAGHRGPSVVTQSMAVNRPVNVPGMPGGPIGTATATTPPLPQVPAKLACLKASPVRSTPGALPYHMP